MLSTIEDRVRALQRELLALKRGMFGGARAYFNTQTTTHTFTGSTSTDLTVRLVFDKADFPFLFARVKIDGGDLADFATQRSGRYTWRIFCGGGSAASYTIKCFCVSEQAPAQWIIEP